MTVLFWVLLAAGWVWILWDEYKHPRRKRRGRGQEGTWVCRPRTPSDDPPDDDDGPRPQAFYSNRR